MKVSVGPIKDGSHGFRVWFHEEPNSEPVDSGEPYQVVGVFERLSEDTCLIGYTMGELSDNVNIAIALEAYSLGYKILKLYVKKGTKVSRWLKLEGTDEYFDYYRVELDEAIRILEKM